MGLADREVSPMFLGHYGIYCANLFGPPPPDVGMTGIAGNASRLFVLRAAWVDHHRRVVA